MKNLSEEQKQYFKSRLNAIPDIPKSKEYWGKIYRSNCPCGGILTACRSTYNGHLHARCDKCEFRLME